MKRLFSILNEKLFSARAGFGFRTAMVAVAILSIATVSGYLYHDRMEEEINGKKELLQALLSARERAERAEIEFRAGESHAAELEKGLIRAGAYPMAGALLQEEVTALAARRGITFTSKKTLSTVLEKGYARVPVEFNFKSGFDGTKALVLDIFNARGLFGVKKLHLRNGKDGMLEVALTVEGLTERAGDGSHRK